MKYKPEEYINCGFYTIEEGFEHHKEKLVKCRKPHECMGGMDSCAKTIHPGEMALYESGFSDGEPVSCYTCIPCLDEWLDELKELQDEEEPEARHDA